MANPRFNEVRLLKTEVPQELKAVLGLYGQNPRADKKLTFHSAQNCPDVPTLQPRLEFFYFGHEALKKLRPDSQWDLTLGEDGVLLDAEEWLDWRNSPSDAGTRTFTLIGVTTLKTATSVKVSSSQQASIPDPGDMPTNIWNNQNIWEQVDIHISQGGQRYRRKLPSTTETLTKDDKVILLDEEHGNLFDAISVFIKLSTMDKLMTPDGPKAYFKSSNCLLPYFDAEQVLYYIDFREFQFPKPTRNMQKRPMDSAWWTKIAEKAVSQSTWKYARRVNPSIGLYIQHCSHNISIDDLKSIVKLIQDEGEKSNPPVNQKVEFIKSEEPDLSEYFMTGISPFQDYKTWVSQADMASYLKVCAQRKLPEATEVEAVKKLLEKIDEKAESSKSKVQDKLRAIRDKVFASQKGKFLKDNHSITYTAITYENMKAVADDPRTGHPNQGQVWGLSATDIAETFKWPTSETWPSTGTQKWRNPSFAAAEWLHKSAYSWGGLVGGSPGTSQIRQNLIFGTSETNSVMARFESSWQTILKSAETPVEEAQKKHKVQDSSQGPILATLVTFNTPHDENQTIRALTLSEDEKKVKVTEKLAKDFESLLQDNMWLCYALDYQLTLSRPGPILKGQYDETFYPFQRLFFTKLEASLDQSLIEFLVKKEKSPKLTPSSMDVVIARDPDEAD